MKIKGIRIKNFSSIQDSDWIHVNDRILVLVGPNAAGKTAILKSLTYFKYNTGSIDPIYKPLNNPDARTELIFKAMFYLNELSEEKKDVIKTIISAPLKREKIELDITKIFYNPKNLRDYKITGKDKYYFTEKKIEAFKIFLKNRRNLDQSIKINIEKATKNISVHIERKNFDKIKEILVDLKKNIKNRFDLNQKSPINDKRIKDLQIFNKDIDQIIHFNKIISEFLPAFITFNFQSLGSILDEINYNEKDIRRKKINELLFESMELNYKDFIEKKGDSQAITQLEINRDTSIENFIKAKWTQGGIIPKFKFESSKLVCGIRENNTVYKISQRSAGEIWFLTFIVFLFSKVNDTNNTDYIILIDEPCVSLHPSAKKDVMNILEDFIKNNENMNIFYTTHSPFLIPSQNLERIVRASRSITKGTKVSSLEKENINELYSELGISPSDYLMFNGFLIVEGPSDIKFFKEILKPFFMEKNIEFLPLRGKQNLKNVNDDLIKEFIDKDLRFLIILDKDEGNKNFYENLPKVIRRNTKLLPVREIENFYLDPNLLCNFLKEYTHIDSSKRKVRNLLLKSIDDEVMNETIMKYFFEQQPIFFNKWQKEHIIDQVKELNQFIEVFLNFYQDHYNIQNFHENYYNELFQKVRKEVISMKKSKDNWKFFPGKKVRTNLIKLLRKDYDIELDPMRVLEILEKEKPKFFKEVKRHFQR